MRLPAFLLRVLPRKRLVPHTVDDDYIAFAFPSEAELTHGGSGPAQLKPVRRKPRLGRGAVAVLMVCAAALAGVAVYSTASNVEQMGSLRVESEPDGAIVTIDGQDRGTTPLVLTLPTGHHAATVRLADRRRSLTVDVEARATTVHHVELPALQAVSPGVTTGTLEIVGDTRARISVDGIARGQAPLSLTALPVGSHDIAVTTGESTVRSTVNVTAGASTSFVVAGTTSSANLSGWMTARTRVPLQIVEQGRIVGTTEADRVLLPVGTHDLEFVNQSLGFRATRRVAISAGKATDVALPLPQAPLQVNAIPWAEVWIDGVRVGETPLANLAQTIGPHEVVFKHPQLGERKVTTTVTMSGPSRATVDMRVP
jgi:serine/threonine-protein kinase